MNKFLLSVHVIAAIIFVGPVTVAASMFPPLARRALEAEQPETGVLKMLHRISRGYAIGGLTVPVFGIAVGAGLGVLTDYWLIVSMVLTAAAPPYWRLPFCLPKGGCWLQSTGRGRRGTQYCRGRSRCR